MSSYLRELEKLIDETAARLFDVLDEFPTLNLQFNPKIAGPCKSMGCPPQRSCFGKVWCARAWNAATKKQENIYIDLKALPYGVQTVEGSV